MSEQCMMISYILPVLAIIRWSVSEDPYIIDMTKPTTTGVLLEHFGVVVKRWKICHTCGHPELGTVMHLEHELVSSSSLYPANIPAKYFVVRLAIIEVSSQVIMDPATVLTLESMLLWPILRRDPLEPTLLLFHFGWKPDDNFKQARNCICKGPGLSYELAEWIAANLTHVVGIATDAPTLESEQSRQHGTRTIASIFGKSGVYMIDNVHMRKGVPEHGCLAIVMPLKLLRTSYSPTRLTAICSIAGSNVVMALQSRVQPSVVSRQFLSHIELDDLM